MTTSNAKHEIRIGDVVPGIGEITDIRGKAGGIWLYADTCGHFVRDGEPMPDKLTAPEAFFYIHAGYSYASGETAEEGRIRCSRELAAAEARAIAEGYSFEWSHDGLTSQEWTDEEPTTPTWQCVMRSQAGEVVGSLGGVDFGDSEPWGSAYRRVTEAELALAHLPKLSAEEAE